MVLLVLLLLLLVAVPAPPSATPPLASPTGSAGPGRDAAADNMVSMWGQ